MPTTVSKGVDVVTPVFVLGWDTSRPSRTVVHDVIGKPVPDFTIRPAGPRRGILTYMFTTLADALACEDLHALDPAPVTVEDVDVPDGGMTYVVTGDVSVSAANDAGTVWRVAVGFVETST